MTIIYDDPIRNARLTVVSAALETGPGLARLKIGTLGMATIIANIDLADPPFLAPSFGTMQLADCPRSDNDTAAGGTAAEAVICDGNGAVRVTGLTVGLSGSGADIILNVVEYAQHQRLDILSGIIRHS